MAALTEAYINNMEPLHGKVMNIIHDYHEAYDIVNETFLKVMMHYGWWLRLGKYGKTKYINSCCRNLCDKYIKENGRIYSVEFLDEVFCKTGPDTCELDDIIEREALKKCVMSLRPSQRRLICFYYIHGMKLEEIAAAENISRDCAAKRLSRTRQSLRSIMNRYCV